MDTKENLKNLMESLTEIYNENEGFFFVCFYGKRIIVTFFFVFFLIQKLLGSIVIMWQKKANENVRHHNNIKSILPIHHVSIINRPSLTAFIC